MKNIAVLGAGASGISAAIEAMKTAEMLGENISVTVFEHLNKPLKKILATGNGRCNFCNTDLSYSHYYGDSEFIKAVLSSKYNNTVDFFETLGLLTYTESGRIYPRSEQASSVRDALLKKCELLNIKISTDFSGEIEDGDNQTFIVDGKTFAALIVATGGKSGVSQGSDGSGYPIFKKYSHKITSLSPALSGLLINEKGFKDLKGLRIKGNLSLYSNGKLLKEEFGEIQFTEQGISGIPVLNASHLYSDKPEIFAVIDLCYEYSFKELKTHILKMKRENELLRTEELLSGLIPQKLAYFVMKKVGIPESTILKNLSDDRISSLCNLLKSMSFKISGIRGFSHSQVTSGGLSSIDFDVNTLMSKKRSGLFGAGEILNVNGECGGYNLHFAWTSGRLAGASAVEFLKG